ncbi:MAG: hypothetical protein LBC98_09055 [Prevotellaceae bacterium]|jgi:hypothetical protein|nr:hypothetical protein [Prevotellaceae bacterium]
MAKIDNETLRLFRDPDDLIGFIALHRYEPENIKIHDSEQFSELPQYLADIIYILDFETLFDVYGLFAFIESTPGKYLSETIAAFERTGNSELAGHLTKVQNLLVEHGLTFDDLHEQAIERSKILRAKHEEGDEDFELEVNFPELRDAVNQTEEELYPLMDERDYWEKVKDVIRNKI